ncbi:MAG: site-2 protease family protein [Gemmatimonadota bacterium]
MLLFALVAHEFAHGWVAHTQGDDTAYMLGRLTLNPIPHIDLFLTLILPIVLWIGSNGTFTFGGAKPVPVNTRNFRNFRRGDILVSGAGVVTNAILAVVCTLLFILVGWIHQITGGLGTSTAHAAQRMLSFGVMINCVLAVFNLIPIPPLDGSRLFYHLLPPALGARYRSLDRFGFAILLVMMLLFQGALTTLLSPAYWSVEHLLSLARPFAVPVTPDIFQ